MPPPPSTSPVEVLAERIEHVIRQNTEIHHVVTDVRARQDADGKSLAVLNERMGNHEESLKRAFTRYDEVRGDLDGLKGEVKTHGFAWKLVGTAVTLALGATTGLIVYSFNAADRANDRALVMEKRTTRSEFRLDSLEKDVNQRNAP